MTNATAIKSDPVEIGDRLYRERRFEAAAEHYSMAAGRLETVPPDLCLKLAHCYQKLKDATRRTPLGNRHCRKR